jgi:hypothetical protein
MLTPTISAAQEPVSLEVLNPIATMEVQRVVPVPRLESLDNKRILLYYNGKINSDVAVQEVKSHLEQRFPRSEFKIFEGTGWAPEDGFYDEVMAWKPEG